MAEEEHPNTALELVRPPVELEPGVRVHAGADRRLATEHWLLSAAPDARAARRQWNTDGVAMLPMGGVMSAVRLPARLLLAIVGGKAPSRDMDALLDEVLEGGPVICDPRHHRYYALVPATMPRTWHQAVDDWRAVDVDCLGRGTCLGVPSITAVEPRGLDSYWSVPMPSAGILCAPLAVARLIAAGVHQLVEEPREA